MDELEIGTVEGAELAEPALEVMPVFQTDGLYGSGGVLPDTEDEEEGA